jgi:S-DNA-T family DNA segregation ATPase FtsK/SpoIIIE
MLYRNPPQFLRFILIDPKRVELTAYDGIPYLLSPVITEGKKAILALKWAVSEMERRYSVLLEARSRDIGSYNLKVGSDSAKILPNIVIFIDELADLMAVYGKELEAIIIRLSQMARATGIHLVVSTQRPSVEVITGLIKANITSRIAFQVASQIDSRTILDLAGAEKLLGRGDLLFISADTSKPRRVQGPFVSETEVERVVASVKTIAERFMTGESWHDSELQEMMVENPDSENGQWLVDGEDELYHEAYRVVVESQKASASLLQRRLRVGYARAARLLDLLESRQVIGSGQGAKPRQVYHRPSNQDQISPILPPTEDNENEVE